MFLPDPGEIADNGVIGNPTGEDKRPRFPTVPRRTRGAPPMRYARRQGDRHPEARRRESKRRRKPALRGRSNSPRSATTLAGLTYKVALTREVMASQASFPVPLWLPSRCPPM